MPAPASDPHEPTPLASLQDRDSVRYSVRHLGPGDRQALQRYYEEFEPKRAAQGLPPQGADRVARWLDTVLPSGIHLIVSRGSELIGHGLLVPTGRDGTFEYAVFLRKDVRGRGLGTELNRIAIEAARTAGIRRLWLSVEPHNRAAMRSYEKVGFHFIPGTMFSPEAEMEMEL